MSTANVNAYALSYTTLSEQIVMYGMLQGAGAAAPVIPTTTVSTTSAKIFCQASANCLSTTATDTTRSATGVYTTKIQPATPSRVPPLVFDVSVSIWGPNGTWGTISDFNPATGVLSFMTFAAGGAAADLAATEFCRFTFTCQQSVPAK